MVKYIDPTVLHTFAMDGQIVILGGYMVNSIDTMGQELGIAIGGYMAQ
jgi:hypothetical protein